MYIRVKRILDIICSVIALIIFAIPMVIISIIIKFDSEGPVIYKQQRIGKNGELFFIYKFRTMIVHKELKENNIDHNHMVTKVGKFLRKTSLDELPQLFNVLKGEMSIVLPGITGLAQIKGRNRITIFKKIGYDIEYVQKLSFKLDVLIIFWTFKTIQNEKNAEISEIGIQEELSELKKYKLNYKKQEELPEQEKHEYLVKNLKNMINKTAEYTYREVI